ncbi:MAG TPA: biosynthetic-type acetolactate synthase large subunit [Phycisphaerae bacterium]|nr:biosynthetic-type acetolactate synthase large subunit [Phycisphaerae bacterium]
MARKAKTTVKRRTAPPAGGASGVRKSYIGMTGAQLFHEMLLEAGVEVLFGFPGGSVLPIFDALYQTPIRFVLTRHEQGAAHMADGYARSTGRVGVCIATSGPGATNLVTGLATAFMDSVPVVALTGQVVSNLIGNDAFQEADTTGITRPITKHNMLVKRVEDLGRSIREAFHIASTGRPGPVVVDIAKDATMATLEAEPKLEMDLPGYKPVTAGHMRQIKAAAEMINESRKPVLYVGGGVIIAEASEDLRALVDKGKFPVTTTLMAMGAIDETDPLALQMLGMHGSAAANYAVQECDCLVAVGARFDDRVTGRIETFAPQAKIIHIDIDPASISKTVVVDVPVVGDAKDILRRLLPLIKPVRRPGWLKQIAGWKRQFPFSYALGERIKPQAVVEAIGRLTAHDAIVTTGVGQHQMWTAQYYGWRRPRQLITSGGLGTMGFGLPAAIGAQFGNPGRTVIDIDGDGSFAMTVGELVTAVQYHQPVKVVVLDNHYLGMVRQWQEMFYNRRYSATEHPCPDLPKLAEALGATGMRVTEPGEVDDAINQMLKTEGPVVLVAEVEPEENVFPMVASGKSLHEMDMGRLV